MHIGQRGIKLFCRSTVEAFLDLLLPAVLVVVLLVVVMVVISLAVEIKLEVILCVCVHKLILNSLAVIRFVSQGIVDAHTN